MVFGRFGGDKRLEAQKIALNEFIEQFDAIQQRVNDLSTIKAQFADVWPSEGVPAELVSEIEKARNLSGMLVQRASTARQELEQFDDALNFLLGRLPHLERSWKVFMAMLLARQTILHGDAPVVPSTDQPTDRDCHIALLGVAESLYADLRKHIDELGPVKAKFDGPWPELLDLPAMERGVADIRGALDVFRNLLNDHALLPEVSTASLMDIIGMMQNSILKIEDCRVDLATHIAMSAAMRNNGLPGS